MFLEQDEMIRLNGTHSHTSQVIAEIRFYKSQKLFEIKDTFSRKFGTLPEYTKLKLIKRNGQERPLREEDDERSLNELAIDDYDTIHVHDLNPNSMLVQNNFDDLSAVKKFEISEEDYNKRDDTVRKFKKKLMSDPNYIAMLDKSKGPTYEDEAALIDIGSRCLLGDGIRRGEVVFVGMVKELGYGFFVGVKLDEPMGDTNGEVKGKKYFTCQSNYGIFVRPNYVTVGDYPPEDIFNEAEDEI
jgi:tubulin-folding cofactor B